MYEKSNKSFLEFIEKFTNKVGTIEIANSYYFMGKNYVELKDYQNAEKYYRKALETDPTYRDTYIALAELSMKRKEYKFARFYLEEALLKSYRHYNWLEDNGYSYDIYDMLDIACFYSGDKKSALAYAAKAFSMTNEERIKENLIVVANAVEDNDLLK